MSPDAPIERARRQEAIIQTAAVRRTAASGTTGQAPAATALAMLPDHGRKTMRLPRQPGDRSTTEPIADVAKVPDAPTARDVDSIELPRKLKG